MKQKLRILLKRALFPCSVLIMPKLTASRLNQRKKNLVTLPLRGLENCWVDIYLAIRYSATHNVCVVFMSPYFLPFGTYENSQKFAVKIKRLIRYCSLLFLRMMLTARGVKTYVICDAKLKLSHQNKYHESALMSFLRRFFGRREIMSCEVLKECESRFKDIYSYQLPFRGLEIDIISSHHIYEWEAVIDNFERSSSVKKKFCWGRNVYLKDILLLSDRPLQVGYPLGFQYLLPENFFEARYLGACADQPWSTKTQVPTALSAFLKAHPNRLVLAPNCIWDGDLPQKESFVSGVEDLVHKSVELARKYPRTGLVVRFHPAEASLWRDRPSLYETLKNIKVPENVLLVPPDSDWSTLMIAKECGQALLYSGMLAYECAHLGVPVFCASNSIHAEALGVIKIDTMEELEMVFEGTLPSNILDRRCIGFPLECGISKGIKLHGVESNMAFSTLPKFTYLRNQFDLNKYFDDQLL